MEVILYIRPRSFRLAVGQRSFTVTLPQPETLHRARLITELGVVTLLFILGLTKLVTPAKLLAVGLPWVWLTTHYSNTSKERLGLVWKNSRNTMWMLQAVTMVCGIIWATGFLTRSFKPVFYDTLLEKKFGYFVFALIQQFIVQSYFVVRLEKLLGSEDRAIRWTVNIFSYVMHFPNPFLMWLTNWGGKAMCDVFKKHRNLYTIAIAQGLVGASISAFWPHWMMVAGVGFWPYVVQFCKFLFGH